MPALAGSRVIYGGSAGPGLLTELGDAVDGLFLGRFAHDPAALELILAEVLDEAAAGRGARIRQGGSDESDSAPTPSSGALRPGRASR